MIPGLIYIYSIDYTKWTPNYINYSNIWLSGLINSYFLVVFIARLYSIRVLCGITNANFFTLLSDE